MYKVTDDTPSTVRRDGVTYRPGQEFPTEGLSDAQIKRLVDGDAIVKSDGRTRAQRTAKAKTDKAEAKAKKAETEAAKAKKPVKAEGK